MSDGMLIVLSAPSGCGKSTMVQRLMQSLSGLVFSISHTTRAPRGREVDGVDYHFVDVATFLALRDQQPSGFLEWAEVHGNYYGTSVDAVQRQLVLGNDVLLDIDVQGAAQVRANSNPVTVFIAPPSLGVLEQRLRGRGTESAATIDKRLRNARQEMAAAGDYDYLIVNDRLDVAVEILRSIVIAERCRRRRDTNGTSLQWES